MINLGTVHRRHGELHRRDFLRLGTCGFAGLTLAGAMRASRAGEQTSTNAKARSCIFIYLAGGYVGDWVGLSSPVTRHVWRYDTVHHTWTPMLSLPGQT